MTTLCPECDFSPCICSVLESAGVTAAAIDEVTRELAPPHDVDAAAQLLMKEARRMANFDEWRREFAERSVLDLDFQRRLTDEDREFLRGCLDWDSRLTRYDKRFLRGCGVKV